MILSLIAIAVSCILANRENIFCRQVKIVAILMLLLETDVRLVKHIIVELRENSLKLIDYLVFIHKLLFDASVLFDYNDCLPSGVSQWMFCWM